MYSDVDQKAAWRHIDSRLLVNRTALDRGLAEAIRFNGPFFRHQPSFVVYADVQASEIIDAMAALQSLRTIVDFTLAIWLPDALLEQQWREMFDQLQLHHLGRFSLLAPDASRSLIDSMASWLPRMTSLHTLELNACWPATFEGATQAICALPHLTHLHVNLRCGRLVQRAAILMGLVDCAHLTQLALSEMMFAESSDLFQQFFTRSKSAPHLKQLSLAVLGGLTPPALDYSAAFACLSHLEELTLCSFDPLPVSLLLHAHHAAALRVIQFQYPAITVGTVEAVRQIHAATPPTVQLRVIYYQSGRAARQELDAIDPQRITATQVR